MGLLQVFLVEVAPVPLLHVSRIEESVADISNCMNEVSAFWQTSPQNGLASGYPASITPPYGCEKMPRISVRFHARRSPENAILHVTRPQKVDKPSSGLGYGGSGLE